MTIRIGFIGAGFMGQLAHLSNYDRVDGCEVVALAEPRDSLRERVARRYHIEERYRDHEALLSGATVDACVAAQPYKRHKYIVPDILESGHHLFTEKPLAVTAGTGDHLATLAEEQDLIHMVGYHKRSDPAMEHAKTVVDKWRETESFGALRYVRVTMPNGDWIGGAPDPITTDEEPPEGLTEGQPEHFDEKTAERYDQFINYYIHQINALRFFLGSIHLTFGDDSGRLLVVENESGTTGVLERAPYRTSDDWQESILIGFDRGYIEVNLPAPLASQESGTVEIMNDDDGTSTRRPTMPPKSAMRRQAENFVAAVRGDRTPPCSSREAVEDLRIADAYFRRQ